MSEMSNMRLHLQAARAWQHALDRQGRRAHDEAWEATRLTQDPTAFCLAQQAIGELPDSTGDAIYKLIDHHKEAARQ